MQNFRLLTEVASVSFVIVPILGMTQGFFLDPKWILDIKIPSIFFLCFVVKLSIIVTLLKLSKAKPLVSKSHKLIINRERLLIVVIIIFSVAQLGFIINLSRLLSSDISSLVGGGRSWELAFGKSTITNYMYFLNGYLVANYPLLKLAFAPSATKSKFVKTLCFISFTSLFFHGVKGTVLFPLIIAYYLSRIININIKLLNLRSIIVFTVILFISNSYLRDTTMLEGNFSHRISKKILLYLTPGYANLQKQTEKESNLAMGKMSLGPLGNIPMLLSTGQGHRETNRSTARVSGTNIRLELIDEAYNTGTILRSAYIDFDYHGFFIYTILIGLYMALTLSWSTRYGSTFFNFLFAVALTQLLFCFWGNHFTRAQYIYWLLVSLTQHIFTRR